MTFIHAALIVAAAAAMTYALILVLFPMLRQYALARPNARSSHVVPTPQGGGIAVVASVIVVAVVAIWWTQTATPGSPFRLAVLLAAAATLAVVGVLDDILSLSIAPRMLLQIVAVLAMIAVLPSDVRVIGALPWDVERALLFVFGVWFVNLTNFMDGLDWITAADTLPVAVGIAVFGACGVVPLYATIVALAIIGAMLGFAPFNRPAARLFLGDVGSLPLGLLLAWLLIELAGRGHLAAAILLPLYPCADATLTILWRMTRGEKVWEAHRSHFYQIATTRGFRVQQVVGQIFAVNVALAGLATLTVWQPHLSVQVISVALGAALVAVLMWRFTRAR